MNKSIISLFALIAILFGCMTTSCKDDDGKSLSGVYASGTDSDGFANVYDFTSKSNVIYYPVVHKGSGTYYGVSYDQKIGKTDYYNSSSFDQSRSYTYAYEDGILVIPMQGKVFSVSGKTLREDGTNTVYTKQ